MKKIDKTPDVGPLFRKDGTVAVDATKYPTLYRSLTRSLQSREAWKRVIELRRAGQDETAGRLVRKLLGVQGPPMSEETKEKLRQYNEEHKDEIKARREQRIAVRRRTLALLATGSRHR